MKVHCFLDVGFEYLGIILLLISLSLSTIPVLAETSVFDNYEFYIEVPSDWEIENKWNTELKEIKFKADFRGKTALSIQNQKNFDNISKVDDVLLQTFTEKQEQECRANTNGPCWDYDLVHSKIVAIGNSKAISIKSSQFLNNEKSITQMVLLPDGANQWVLFGKAADSGIEFADDIEKAISTFKIKGKEKTSTTTPTQPIFSSKPISDPSIVLEREIIINMILVGDKWGSLRESVLRSDLPSYYDPIIVSSKEKSGIRYHYTYNFYNAEESQVKNLSNFMTKNSVPSPIFGSDIIDFPIWQAAWVASEHPEWIDFDPNGNLVYNVDYRKVDALAMEKYLYDTIIGSEPALNQFNSVNLIFLATDLDKVDFLHNYILSGKDDATAKKHEYVGLMGFGGNYNMFFFDLYAVPWLDIDTFTWEYIFPEWIKTLHDCYDNRCFTDLVTYHAESAIHHIITPSYLYPIENHPKYVVDVLVYNKPGSSLIVDTPTLKYFVNEKKILEELQYLYPFAEWEITYDVETREKRNLSLDFKSVMEKTKYFTFPNQFGEEKTIGLLSSAEIQPELRAWAKEKRQYESEETFIIPVLIEVDSSDHDIYLDSFGILGFAPSLEENESLPCCAYGVTDQGKVWEEGIGFTDLLLHEVGHVLGLNHPFLSWDEIGDIQRNEYFNWYASPMTYSSPSSACGTLFYLLYSNSCGNPSLSFTSFERDRISDSRMASLIKKTNSNLENMVHSSSGIQATSSVKQKLAESMQKFDSGDLYSLGGALVVAIEAHQQSIGFPSGKIKTEEIQDTLPQQKIPEWIKNNVKWWSEDQIDDATFVNGIQFLIEKKIVDIPDLPKSDSTIIEKTVPSWIKNNADWWSKGLISEGDFVKGIEFLVKKGIIQVN